MYKACGTLLIGCVASLYAIWSLRRAAAGDDDMVGGSAYDASQLFFDESLIGTSAWHFYRRTCRKRPSRSQVEAGLARACNCTGTHAHTPCWWYAKALEQRHRGMKAPFPMVQIYTGDLQPWGAPNTVVKCSTPTGQIFFPDALNLAMQKNTRSALDAGWGPVADQLLYDMQGQQGSFHPPVANPYDGVVPNISLVRRCDELAPTDIASIRSVVGTNPYVTNLNFMSTTWSPNGCKSSFGTWLMRIYLPPVAQNTLRISLGLPHTSLHVKGIDVQDRKRAPQNQEYELLLAPLQRFKFLTDYNNSPSLFRNDTSSKLLSMYLMSVAVREARTLPECACKTRTECSTLACTSCMDCIPTDLRCSGPNAYDWIVRQKNLCLPFSR